MEEETQPHWNACRLKAAPIVMVKTYQSRLTQKTNGWLPGPPSVLLQIAGYTDCCRAMKIEASVCLDPMQDAKECNPKR